MVTPHMRCMHWLYHKMVSTRFLMLLESGLAFCCDCSCVQVAGVGLFTLQLGFSPFHRASCNNPCYRLYIYIYSSFSVTTQEMDYCHPLMCVQILGFPLDQLAKCLLATPVQFVIGWRFHRGAYLALKSGR